MEYFSEKFLFQPDFPVEMRKRTVYISNSYLNQYNFDFPLQLSIDVRPQLGLVNEAFGVWGWYPHLGIRYRF